jgi:predicted helicase
MPVSPGKKPTFRGVTTPLARGRGEAKAVAGPSLPPGREGYKLDLVPTHKPVRAYYEALAKFEELGTTHEGAVRDAFGTLLKHCAAQVGWTLVGEYSYRRRGRHPAQIDGALLDRWRLPRVYWEAKDSDDDLEKEVRKKIADGYPTDNIVFQAPERAILYQSGKRQYAEDIRNPQALVDLIMALFRYRAPPIEEWETAADEFGAKVPELSAALAKIIEQERKNNQTFVQAFDNFCDMCRTAINPNIGEDAVERMLVQHLLTERIFRKVFDNSDFAQRNVIAIEIEKVIRALTSRAFNRDKFLANLDRFYGTLEMAAATIDDYSQKQSFLNRVYERFFQGFDEKTADTHGIVYTPQSIVRFMIRSVDDLLRKEFGKSLGDAGVHIIDPFVGTGNFVLHVMRSIPKTRLVAKYGHEIHANEIMLLPYYVAAMNIEHEYAELTGEYRPFDGLCLVDTFELAESRQQQLAFMSPVNSQRVERQKRSPIFAIIGNPPYNAWQINENDRNKNRKYDVIDKRVKNTYAADSDAQLVNSLRDPYVKAYRWATDRLGEEGVLAFVSNGSYVSKAAFDGMRRNLGKEYDEIYVLDLGGDVRSNPKISGTTHNVFGDKVSIAIGFLVRRKRTGTDPRNAKVFYAKTGEQWRKEQKFNFLNEAGTYSNIKWTRVEPDAHGSWLTEGLREDFGGFMPVASAEFRRQSSNAIFQTFSNGIKSNNDAYVFDFSGGELTKRTRKMVAAYNAELARWQAEGRPRDIDGFLRVDEGVLKWVRKTKRYLGRGQRARFEAANIRNAMYRPFVSQRIFFDRMFNEDVYQLDHMFPAEDVENTAIVVSDAGHRSAFSVLAVRNIPEHHLCASTDAVQVLAFQTFDDEGSCPRDNVTDWAVTQFREHYGDESIAKKDVFNYVYAVLHHPEYRDRYKENLKRELPRIPFAPNFEAFASAGRALMDLHLKYENAPEWPLVRQEAPHTKLEWRVERMKISRDRRAVIYNEFLTLVGVPEKAYAYRLGGRSALEWIIDQYQVSTDKRSGITNDPNRLDEPDYIIRLIGKVIHVSVETMKIVEALPPIDGAKSVATMSPNGSSRSREIRNGVLNTAMVRRTDKPDSPT